VVGGKTIINSEGDGRRQKERTGGIGCTPNTQNNTQKKKHRKKTEKKQKKTQKKNTQKKNTSERPSHLNAHTFWSAQYSQFVTCKSVRQNISQQQLTKARVLRNWCRQEAIRGNRRSTR